MKLDNPRILEKLRGFFQDPVGIPDLPEYIVAIWKLRKNTAFKTAAEMEDEKIQHGAIFRTTKLEDLRTLYFLMRNDEVKDLRLYQITPERIVYLIEFMGVNI